MCILECGIRNFIMYLYISRLVKTEEESPSEDWTTYVGCDS